MTGTGREGRLIPLIIGAALFMQTLDGYSISTALPAAARSFGVAPVALSLALTAYFVGAAAFLPISGWCADRFGARTVFQAAIIGFTIGSVGCGLAPTPTTLIAARALQGISGAGLMPIARLILLRTSSKSELVQQMTYLTIPPMLGPLFGPVLGGAAATFGSWRWMFAVNVVVGLVGLGLVSRYVPRLREHGVPRLDAPGALLASAFLVSSVLLLDRAGRPHGFDTTGATLASVMVIAALAYGLHARRASAPILDLSLIRFPTFTAGVIGGLFYRLSLGAEPFLTAMLFQVSLGMTAFMSGVLTLATSIGMAAMRTVSIRLLRGFGFRRLLIVNTVVSAALLGALGFVGRATPLALVIGILLARGLARALQLNALNTVTYAEPPPERASAASSLAATVQQLAQALSMAGAAAIITAAGALRPAMPALGVSAAFVTLAAVSLVSLPFFFVLSDDAGAELSGHRLPAMPRTAEEEPF